MDKLTHTRAKELLCYNEDTGELTWRISQKRSIAGKIAGCISYKKNGDRIQIHIDGKPYYAHRLIWLYVYGKFPENHIDHIDGDTMNNRLSNLRDVTRSENSKNQRRHDNNSSGCTGVSFFKAQSCWCARISIDSRWTFIGNFKEYWDAACARKSAEHRLGFHQNHGRVLINPTQ